jgi:hypothetical protein
MQGALIPGVQELVGHQRLAMTQRQSHLSPAALDATIRLLEKRTTLRAFGDSLETRLRQMTFLRRQQRTVRAYCDRDRDEFLGLRSGARSSRGSPVVALAVY